MTSVSTIAWRYYPTVAAQAPARAFIEALAKRQKAPKTVDAYARNIEDLYRTLASFAPQVPLTSGEMATRVVEATDADLDDYLDALASRRPHPNRVPRGAMPSTPPSTPGLSKHTLQQRVVTVRLYYDFLIRRHWRHDPANPVPRGSDGRDGRLPRQGPIRLLRTTP